MLTVRTVLTENEACADSEVIKARMARMARMARTAKMAKLTSKLSRTLSPAWEAARAAAGMLLPL